MHVIGVFYCPYTANKFEIFSRSFARASSLQNFLEANAKISCRERVISWISRDKFVASKSRFTVSLGSNQRKGYFNNCIIYWHQINNYGLFFLLFKHLAVFGLFIISGNIYSTLSIMFTLSTITPPPISTPHYSTIQLYTAIWCIILHTPFYSQKIYAFEAIFKIMESKTCGPIARCLSFTILLNKTVIKFTKYWINSLYILRNVLILVGAESPLVGKVITR